MKELLLLFFTVAVTDFFAEMGDKTQLMLIGLTNKYKIWDIIFGTLVAILVLNGVAVLAGGVLNQFIPGWLVKFIAAAAFLFFAATSLKKDDEDEEEAAASRFKFAPVAVFCTFFIAELGDKTQLTAITFGANSGLQYALVIWLACSVGLFAADILGMLIGMFLKKAASEWVLGAVAFVLFGVFGFVTLHEALGLLQKSLAARESAAVVPVLEVMIAVAVIFAAVCGVIFLTGKKQKKTE